MPEQHPACIVMPVRKCAGGLRSHFSEPTSDAIFWDERDPVNYRSGKHPNSLKNLRSPWKKGESGNQRGRPPGISVRQKLLDLVDADLKEEAQQLLLEAFARGEPWAVELITGE
jgi:hypothetical protein